jgi:hypothetical protein
MNPKPESKKSMKTDSPTSTSPAPKSAPERHRLRDDPVFQAHYNSILGGLYSTFPTIEIGDDDYESPEAAFKALSEKLEYFTTVAYQAAAHAHCYAQRIEPYSDEEVTAFNSAINVAKNGEDEQ